MKRMIRRQVYLEADHQARLAHLAALWGCSESEVLRRAISQLSDADDPIDARLFASGLLVPAPTEEARPLSEEAEEELERRLDRLAEARTTSLGLAEATVEDRR